MTCAIAPEELSPGLASTLVQLADLPITKPPWKLCDFGRRCRTEAKMECFPLRPAKPDEILKVVALSKAHSRVGARRGIRIQQIRLAIVTNYPQQSFTCAVDVLEFQIEGGIDPMFIHREPKATLPSETSENGTVARSNPAHLRRILSSTSPEQQTRVLLDRSSGIERRYRESRYWIRSLFS